MNHVDFTLPGGFPLDQEILQLLQDNSSMAAFSALLGGTQYVLKDCVQTGSNVTNGIVVINSEILPFVGGIATAKIIIVESVTTLNYEDGSTPGVQKVRYATFGDDGVTTILWADFKRNTPSNGLLARVDKIEKMLRPLLGYDVSGTTVYGSWLFWGRPAIEIPEGWEAVPDADWKGKVPVVLDAAQAEFATVGQTGGVKAVTLSGNQSGVQDHDHNFKGSGSGSSNPGLVMQANQDTQKLRSTFGTGSGGTVDGGAKDAIDAHTNLQPYKVVMFIRFIG